MPKPAEILAIAFVSPRSRTFGAPQSIYSSTEAASCRLLACACRSRASEFMVYGRCLDPLHKAIDHLLLAGLFKGDGKLVPVDLDYVAVAEFQVEDAVIQTEFRCGAGGFRDQFALDRHGRALGA